MNRFEEILKFNKIRITVQRASILKVLHENKDKHMDAEYIHDVLSRKKNIKYKIGLATVYRTLDLFEEKGLTQRLNIDKMPARYELNCTDTQVHHHLICLECGKVEEIPDEAALKFKEIIRDLKDFTVKDRPMKIYGYCKDCKK